MMEPKHSPQECALELEREIKYRRSVFARQVAENRLTQREMDRRISIFLQLAAEQRAKDEANPASSGRLL